MKSMTNVVCLVLLTTVSVWSVRPTLADNEPKSKDTKQTKETKDTRSHDESAYLGVLVTSVHPALARHLKELPNPNQGLTVEEVADDSPAEKADIQAHDILLNFDDQKLFSAEQFAKLVHSDKPGRQAKLELLRDGKKQTIQVTLGKADEQNFDPWMEPMDEPPFHFGHLRRMQRRLDGQRPAGEWKDFDSLTLKKLGDNKFHVEVQYLGKDNQTHKHAFEGTRDEIRTAIRQEKDLKPAERSHLLRSLNMHPEDAFGGPWFDHEERDQDPRKAS